MTWLALRKIGGPTQRIGATGLPVRLDVGTLVFELDLDEVARVRGPVLRLAPRMEPQRIFALEATTDGRLHFLRRHGPDVSHLSIGLGRVPVSGQLRLSYHWDHRRGRSLLTAENLTSGTIRQQEANVALPLLAGEIGALFDTDREGPRHTALDWFGLADHWQTVGPTPGLAPWTEIVTADGPRPIASIRPGDLVLTADEGLQPVLWQGGVEVPAIGSFRPVRLIAPYFGLGSDLVAQPSQRIALSGADVEYHFGEEEVLVEARHLVNGETAVWEAESATAICHGLLLERHALIAAGGVWTESLYLGRIAANPALARTTAPGALAARGALPLHSSPVRRELLEFEALELSLARLRRRAPRAV
ncbi:Hint domain-containing protein [Defluviimonas sp. WL0024]|uniref:Hint domain-containing protein n=2 Tax=Albidovulum TaxID=205889 RepID=A0ABT3J351_9RHOB|nr:MULTISPECIES: Hint domain-containing protein [Defluviimonas]MCU9849515.1 Hint domain-containing protein [Defluviimonas sp. WL0024]MCW3782081.1 Hint domain-containing protein [Defluviimonas salinarum]